jgi:hypothetical protein
VQRALRATPAHQPRMRDVQPQAAAAVAAEPVRAVAQRRLSLSHYSLIAFLAQHPDYWARVDVSILKDEQLRSLVASAQESHIFDAPWLLNACPAEISDAVAKALGSDEFAGDEDANKTFESIVTSIRFPSDLSSLMQERSAAIERGDRELTEKLNARIIAVRRSSR